MSEPRRVGRPRTNPQVEIDPTQFESNEALAEATGTPEAPMPRKERSTRRRKRNNIDPLHIDPNLIPEGMTYEWKVETVMGMEAEAEMVDAQEYGGWSFVPSSRKGHERLGQRKYREGNRIGHGGLVLMERPKELTEEARAEDAEAAAAQVGTQMRRLQLTSRGEMDRVVQKRNRSYEAYQEPTE